MDNSTLTRKDAYTPVKYDARKRWLTPRDVAELLAVTQQEIVKLCKRGDLPSARVGRLWRIPLIEFEEWMEREKTRSREIYGYGTAERIS